jgi:hypothetical protein
LGAALLVAVPAGAETDVYGGGNTQPTVESVPPPSDAEASDASRDPGDSLPFTGGDIGGLVALGLVGVAGGTALLLRSRRTSDAH